MLTYESVAGFAQTWGTIGFVALFTMVLIYALNPRKKDEFDTAAHLPLEKD